MIGGAIGASAIGGVPDIERSSTSVALSVSTIVVPESGLLIDERKVAEGRLIRSIAPIWTQIAREVGSNWSLACQLTPEQWEEMVAGAFKVQGFEVVLTPRSGDFGRDIIARSHGVGCVKILGSVKAYSPGTLVTYDAIRALLGVVATDPLASKGIITTTSDFPPRVREDPQIASALPTRLELMNGQQLQQWLRELSQSQT